MCSDGDTASNPPTVTLSVNFSMFHIIWPACFLYLQEKVAHDPSVTLVSCEKFFSFPEQGNDRAFYMNNSRDL